MPTMTWKQLSIHGRKYQVEENSLVLTEGGKELPSGFICDPVPTAQVRAVSRPSMIVLLPTFDCNLACRYCFREKVSEEQMSFETARRAVSLMDPAGPIKVSFFGGEPLLCWDLIQLVTIYIRGRCDENKRPRTRGRGYHLHVTTNGYLLDADKAQWFAEHGFSIILSLDGPQEIHDTQRVDKDGRGTWQRAMQAAQNLTDAKVQAVTLRSTFGPDDIHLRERVEFLNGLVNQGLGRSVSVEPSCLDEHECSAGASRGFSPRDIALLAREYHRLAKWMLEEYEARRAPRHMQLERMTRRLLDRRISCSQCGAGNRYISVGPEGEIYACHHASEDHIIGSLRDGFADNRHAWIDNRYTRSATCRRCWMRNLCGGACRADCLLQTGELWRPSRTHCAIRFLWIKEAIWLIGEARRRGFIDHLYQWADRGHGQKCG